MRSLNEIAQRCAVCPILSSLVGCNVTYNYNNKCWLVGLRRVNRCETN